MIILKKISWATLLVVMALVIVYFMVQMKMHRSLTDSDSARKAGTPLPVKVETVGSGVINETVAAECATLANPLLKINSTLTDTSIKSTLVKIGDYVNAGDLIIALDDSKTRARYESSRQRASWLQKEIDERREVVDYFYQNRKNGLSLETDYRRAKIDMLDREGELNSEKAELQLYERQIEDTKIKAPYAGIVVSIAKPGENVTQTRDLAEIAVIDPALVQCKVPDFNLPRMQPDDTMELTFYAKPGSEFSGKVATIVPLLDPDARVFQIQVMLENSKRELLPGMVGVGRIQKQASGLRVPAVALVNPQEGEAQIFVIDDNNKAELRTLKTGVYGAGYVEAISGVSAGEKIVTAGQGGLLAGDNVRIAE